MKRSCKYCGRIHDSKYDCGKKPEYRGSRKIKEAEAGRYTNRWKVKARQIKEDAHWLCECCADRGVFTYGNLEAHHIIPLIQAPELLLEDENLVALCRSCHEQAENGEINRVYLQELALRRINRLRKV